MSRLGDASDALDRGYISKEEYAKIALDEQAITPEEYAKIAPAPAERPAGPSFAQQAKGAAQAAAGAIERPFRALQASKPVRAIPGLTQARIPVVAEIQEAKERAPGEIGSAISEALARRGIPGSSQIGTAAGAPFVVADAATMLPKTVGEATAVAATAGALKGAQGIGNRLPILGEEIGAIANAIRRRMGIPEVADVVPPGQAPFTEPVPPAARPQPPAATPTPEIAGPDARPALTGPPAAFPILRPRMAYEPPIRGEGFELVQPSPRPVYNLQRGAMSPLSEPSEPLSAVARRLGITEPPAAPPRGRPAKPAPGTSAAPTTEAGRTQAPKLTQKLARDLAGNAEAIKDPASVDLIVALVKEGKATAPQMKRWTTDLNLQYQRATRRGDLGAAGLYRKALESLGIKPVEPVLESDLPSLPNQSVKAAMNLGAQQSAPATPPAPPAPIEPPAPESAPQASEPAAPPSSLVLEAQAGKKLWQMTATEFKQRFPKIEPSVHKEAVRVALDKEPVPVEVAESYPDLLREIQEEQNAAQEKEFYRSLGTSKTPVSTLARKMGINLRQLEAGSELGITDTLAERAYTEGLIPEYDKNMVLDALDHEARTGTPKWTPGMVHGVIPPGQEGAINPGAIPPRSSTPILDELKEMRESGSKKPGTWEQMKRGAENIETNFADDLASARTMMREAEKLRGKPFTPEQNLYIQSKLYSGVGGIVEEMYMQLNDIRRPLVKIRLDEDFDAYLSLVQLRKRIDDLFARANEYVASGDKARTAEAQDILKRIAQNEVNPRAFNRVKIDQGLTELDAKLGPVKMRLVEDAAKKWWGVGRDLLTQARDAELIQPSVYDKIVSRGESYTPVQVLEYLEAELSGAPSRSLSSRSQDVVRMMQGTTKDIRGAIPASYDKFAKSIFAIERNKVGILMDEYRKIPGMEKVILELKGDIDPPKGFSKFYVFRKGVRKTLALPDDMAQALKGMGYRELSFLENVFGKAGGLLRAGATGANIEFALTNLKRDFGELLLLSEYGVRTRNLKEVATVHLQAAEVALDVMKAMWNVTLKDDTYRAALKSRAMFSTLQRMLTPEALSEQLRQEGKPAHIARQAARLIPRLISILEESTKVAAFKRGTRLGDSPSKVAYEVRTFSGTPDFQAGGRYKIALNLLAPFSGVRIQGGIREVKRSLEHPGEQTVKYSLVALHALLLGLWARQYHREEWEKTDKVAKQNNWIIPIGFFTTTDGKRVPKLITIPKSHIEEVIGGVVDNLLDEYFKVAGRDAVQKTIDTLIIFSPITLNISAKRPWSSLGMSMISSLNPVIKAPAEVLSEQGVNTYQQVPLQSQSLMARHPYARFRPSTSETAKLVGRAFAEEGQDGTLRGGVSPIKLQHAARTFGAGVADQALYISDAILRKLGAAPPSDLNGWEAMTHTPIIRRFVGARAESQPAATEELYRQRTEMGMDKATAKAMLAEALLARIKNPTPKALEAYQIAARQAAMIDPEIVGRAQEAAFTSLGNRQISDAYQIFDEMSDQDQTRLVRSLRRTEAGQAILGQLYQEFRRRAQ